MKKSPFQVLLLGLLPFLLFALVVWPYQYLNETVLVEVFGCGCPQIDENGNAIESAVNANDITAVFWLVIAILVTIIAAILARRLPRRWLRIMYVLGVFLLSLAMAQELYRHMMWM